MHHHINIKKHLINFLLLSLTISFFSLQLTGQQKSTPRPGEERIQRAIEVLKDLAGLKEEGIPVRLLEKAEGLAIFPGVVKAAWGLGGQYGRGIVLIKRPDGQWSNPLFIDLIGGSLGWQIGVQKADLVLVFKNRKGVENIASNKITLGADMSVAAGPVGRSAEASTDLEMEAEIYSYSRSKGLFAGISIKGGTLRVNKEANSAFYGSSLEPSKILYENLRTPVIVIRLHQTIDELTGKLKKD